MYHHYLLPSPSPTLVTEKEPVDYAKLYCQLTTYYIIVENSL